MNESEENEFKVWKTLIFSTNYLIQGMVQSLFSVIVPIYLIIIISETGEVITPSDIAFLASIVMLPWAIKFLFGILSDRFGSKTMGRRRPWILAFMIMSGSIWIFLPFFLIPEYSSNIIIIFTIAGVFINLGVAVGDTVLDGFILDICPKEHLGRVQGTCWGFKYIGVIGGGPLLAFIVVSLGATVESIFTIFGFLTIIISMLVLMIKEPLDYPRAEIRKNLGKMFKRGKDWKMYFFALFNAFIDGVVLLFMALYILIQWEFISAEGASLELLDGVDLSIYMYQAYISLIISVGIIIGAVVGGYYSDLRSRRGSVYLSLIISTVAILLIAVPLDVWLLLVLASLVGIGMGWRHSSYSAVLGQFSKEHPEMISSYFSIANSFVNVGTVLGLVIIGIIFEITLSFIVVFIFMAIVSNLGILPFVLIKQSEYEIIKEIKNFE